MEQTPGAVQSVERVIAILSAFSRERREYSLTELSLQLGLTKSTLHRLLGNLERHRLVERDPQTQRYRLGIKLFELGTLVQTGLQLHTQSRPVLQQLTDDTGQASYVCIVDQGEVLCLDLIESQHTVRVLTLSIGGRIPFHCGGAPRALLAFLPDDQIAAIIDQGLQPVTAQTITDGAVLWADVARTRARGYVIARSDFTEHISAIGAPLFDHAGQLAGAISIAGLSQHFDDTRIAHLVEHVCRAAITISRRLGYTGPHPSQYGISATRDRTA